MSGLPEVIYLIKDSCRYEVVWSDSAFPYGDKKYISAEKAKADKLALLSEIKIIVSAEYIPPPEGFVNETVKENNETVDVLLAQIESIKQRIEAE